eukprot:2805948-Pleurochrysis_carterae.AAC.1
MGSGRSPCTDAIALVGKLCKAIATGAASARLCAASGQVKAVTEIQTAHRAALKLPTAVAAVVGAALATGAPTSCMLVG